MASDSGSTGSGGGSGSSSGSGSGHGAGSGDDFDSGSGGGAGSGSAGAGGSAGQPKMGDAIKKIVTAGISAAFMTEESIRGFVSDLKLPKETLNVLLAGASKSKDELMNRVSREVISMISKIDLVKEASRFVEEHKFKISAEIEVVRRDPAAPATNSVEVSAEPKS